MTPIQAAAKAFRNCRLNHAKSRQVASYLTRSYLINSGLTPMAADDLMPEANTLLDEWFAERTKNPGFVPSPQQLPKIETTLEQASNLSPE